MIQFVTIPTKTYISFTTPLPKHKKKEIKGKPPGVCNPGGPSIIQQFLSSATVSGDTDFIGTDSKYTHPLPTQFQDRCAERYRLHHNEYHTDASRASSVVRQVRRGMVKLSSGGDPTREEMRIPELSGRD